MNRIPRHVSVAMLVIIMLVSLSIPVEINPIQHVGASKYGDIVPEPFELALIEKINENRSTNGAGPITLNSTLHWVARAHTQDMIDNDFFDHTSSKAGPFNGATFSERVRYIAEYKGLPIGECIAWNSWGIDVEWCMSTWKDSSGHWGTIIDPDFTEVGMGIMESQHGGSSGSAFYTVDFGGGTISVDLAVDSASITFDPASPSEGEVVNISANISNLGASDTYPVSFGFYDGDPESGGVLIGTQQELSHILVHGESSEVYTNWDTTGLIGSHDIYVVVDIWNDISETSEANNRAQATIDMGGSVPPPMTILLDEGWNLVSFPYVVNETSLNSVLDSISGKYDFVKYYDSTLSSSRWQCYDIQKPFELNKLDHLTNGMGFWIHVNDAAGADLVVQGDDPASPQLISLYKGWNLVGYPSLSEKTLETANLPGEVEKVEYFNRSLDQWQSWERGGSPPGEFSVLQPGKGYWVYACADCVWDVPH
jgi:uncharacterized protein YkwD